MELIADDSYGRHEVLHVASIIEDMTDRYLLQHPSIALDADLKQKVQVIADALGELYQAIGQKAL